MKAAAYEDFALAPGLVQLNHASYGLTSRRVMGAAEEARNRIEADPTFQLGGELTELLQDRTFHVAGAFGLEPRQTTLCANATSGAAAVINSLPLTAGDTVVVLDTEYSSIIRAWELASARAEANFVVVPVTLPFHAAEHLLVALDAAVPGAVTYLQMSLVSSSAAVRLPVHEIAEWVHHRGGRLILDAAHGPGHVPVTPSAWGAAAMFGTLHKWLPALRAVGFLWLAEEFVDRVRPAEVSLTWDALDLIERFSWPGTFDPVPRLTIDTAREQWADWQARGLLAECEALADTGSRLLTDCGARPTADGAYLPPRMRAFLLGGVTVSEIKDATRAANIRVWAGPDPRGECLLRFAIHIYNDVLDLEALARTIKEVLTR
ncbi:isopenicillin-N epimerase [Nocardia kruczakiae]|uniref:Isopenicillin-N epimerase n=1 Tax=Nocardia kruczakiae TaxID=261477 RepID=A0ABU1X8U6_9NOCA|nr:aminotransferase class V-fold PLP-dependent enzyme [Nocardia kruczakiae]MDR7166502.1 isopenicillin-N epimerase [Nocardia kruczakiae]